MKEKTAATINNLKPVGFMLMGAIILILAAFMFWLAQNWDVQQKCLMYPEAVRKTPISVQVTIND